MHEITFVEDDGWEDRVFVVCSQCGLIGNRCSQTGAERFAVNHITRATRQALIDDDEMEREQIARELGDG